jgi:hypothetical protein
VENSLKKRGDLPARKSRLGKPAKNVLLPRIYLSLLFAALTVVSAPGYGTPADSVDRIPLRHDFPIDKAGRSMVIDFQLREGQDDLSRRLMVAIEFPHDYQRARDYLIRAEPPLRVRVWRIDRGSTTELTVLDMDSIFSVRGKFELWRGTASVPMNSMMHLHVHGYTASRDMVVAGGFRAYGYGHYRVRVETPYDLPVMAGVPTELVIRDFYNMGK